MIHHLKETAFTTFFGKTNVLGGSTSTTYYTILSQFLYLNVFLSYILTFGLWFIAEGQGGGCFDVGSRGV